MCFCPAPINHYRYRTRCVVARFSIKFVFRASTTCWYVCCVWIEFFHKMWNRIKFAFQFGIEKLTGHNIGHINSFTDFVQFMYTPVDGSSLAVGRIMFGSITALRKNATFATSLCSSNKKFSKIFFAFFLSFLKRILGDENKILSHIKGLMMLIDIPEERGGSIFDIRFGRSTNCFFPLFPFVKPMDASKMGIVYACLWLGWCSLKYTVSSFFFSIYVFRLPLGALGIAIGYKFRLSAAMFVATYWYIFLLDKSVWNNHSYLYGLCGILFLASSSHTNL